MNVCLLDQCASFRRDTHRMVRGRDKTGCLNQQPASERPIHLRQRMLIASEDVESRWKHEAGLRNFSCGDQRRLH